MIGMAETTGGGNVAWYDSVLQYVELKRDGEGSG